MRLTSVRLWAATIVVTGLPLLLSLQWAGTAQANIPGTNDHFISGNPATFTAVASYVSRYPRAFAGVWVNEGRHTLNVGVTSDASGKIVAGIDRVAQAKSRPVAGNQWSLNFVRSGHSLSSLGRTMRSVTTAQPWATLSARYLSVWYVDSRADRVVVGLTRITPSLRRAAMASLGRSVKLALIERPAMLTYRRTFKTPPRIVHVSASRVRPATCSRVLDCTPYWGGDRLIWWNSTTVDECTQAFPWTPSGHGNTFDVSATAGHCGPTNRTWHQGYYNASNHTIYYTGIAGTTNLRSWGNNLADGETLSNADMTIIVYDESSISGPGATIGSYAQPVQGQTVCADGSFTYQNCSGTVQTVDTCVNVSDGGTTVHVCHLAYATSSSRLAQAGDSGGPVYEYTSHGSPPVVKLNGLISAGNSSGTQLYFSNMNGLKSALNGHPTT